MNRKSKEEILQANLERVRKENPSYVDNIVDHIDEAPLAKEISFLAMQEYADQEMASFAEWVKYKYISFGGGWVERDKEGSELYIFTTQQLIKKYKEEHGEQ